MFIITDQLKNDNKMKIKIYFQPDFYNSYANWIA